jgi:hypothetical protein
MSVLKRVEEAYLEVLRFIIIAAASLLLIGAVVVAGLAASNWSQHAGSEEQASAPITPEDVTNKVVAAKSDAAPATGKPVLAESTIKAQVDPNQPFHERTATAIVNFVTKYGKGVETLDKASVLEVTHSKTQLYNDAAVAADFAQGLAITMEKSLTDPKIIKLVELPPVPVATKPATSASMPSTETEEVIEGAVEQPVTRPFKESPIGIVNEVLKTYERLFAEKTERKAQEKAQAELDEVTRKATAMTQIYIAGGAFGAFLMLVFISIVVKIERNLRVLGPVTSAAETK